MSDEAALFGSAQSITPKYFRMITRSFSSLPNEKISKMKRTNRPNHESNTVLRLTELSYLTYIHTYILTKSLPIRPRANASHHTHVDTAVDVEA